MKIALCGIYYPFAMLSYFRRALERRNNVELFTFGAFTGQFIPWNGGMQIPMKYHNQVDLPLPQEFKAPKWEQIKDLLPWKPDLVLNVDAGFHLSSKPDVPYAVVATDPHVLGDWYENIRHMTDYFFNMQSNYMKDGDILLPYAFDPKCHYPEIKMKDYQDRVIGESNEIREYDCSIIGLHYTQRDGWVRRLRELGIKVNYRIGDIYDEYREENNKAWIGLNWSSLQDINARVFEICAMRLVPVLNRLPGMDVLGFEENRHYLGFSTMDEAVEKVQWAISHRPQAEQIALEAYQFVNIQKMTWDNRVEQILQKTNLL